MDDDFELISKSVLEEIKEENKKLKERLERREEHPLDKRMAQEIMHIVEEEIKKEREAILKQVHEIKDLNKSTLNNIVTKTESLDHKIEDLIEGLNSMLKTLSDVVTEIHNSKAATDIQKLSELGEKIDMINYNSDDKKSEEVMKKLKEIEDFMEKLKMLLSQVKPSDMKVQP